MNAIQTLGTRFYLCNHYLKSPKPIVWSDRKKNKESFTSKLNTPTAFSISHNRTYPNTSRSFSNDAPIERRSTFNKGVICTYCHKEGQTKLECYRNVGYLVGHPMHNKNFTPKPQGRPTYTPTRAINSVQSANQEPSMTPDSTNDPSTPGIMFVKMDQL